MSRRVVGVMLVALGIAMGITVNHFGRMENAHAAMQADVADLDSQDIAAQLKDIKGQVKDINTLLQSGKLRVVVVVNPD